MSATSASKELFGGGENELTELKKEFADAQENLIKEWNAIRHAIDENDIDQANLAAIGYQKKLELYLKINTALIEVYSRKLHALKHQNIDEKVSTAQKKQLFTEVKTLEQLCSLDLRKDGDTGNEIHEKIFSNLLDNFETSCPLIYSVLHALLVSESDVRQRVHKTPEYKMKCGVNALALLLSIRNQKFPNDVRLLFGLVCVTYGAGKQFINMLNSIGLTPHWDTVYVYFTCIFYSICLILKRCSTSKKNII